MGRWEPDARGRLARATLVLSAEQGFDATTVAQIAEHAGVTERTFYRHFSDKADAFFPDSTGLRAELVVVATRSLRSGGTALDAVLAAVRQLADYAAIEPERALLTARVVPTVPALAGRDLVRLHQIADDLAAALSEHGVPDREARLAAQTGIAVWRVAQADWAADPEGPPLSEVVAGAAQSARTLPR